MKTIALALFAAALGCAQSQSGTSPATTPATTSAPKAAPKAAPTAQKKKPAQPTTQQKAEAQSQMQSIPPGATLVEPNLYRYTDSSGKTWNYRQTPFGISRWEETSAPQPISQPAQAKSDPVVVTDLGDSYRFEKKTPFGASTWVRKKSELTDEEKTLTGGQAQSNPNQNSVISKSAGNQ
jgi:glucose/arabinose dehydrogenase